MRRHIPRQLVLGLILAAVMYSPALLLARQEAAAAARSADQATTPEMAAAYRKAMGAGFPDLPAALRATPDVSASRSPERHPANR
jgi:hypothetical protein